MTETQTPARRPRITHAQRVRLSGLLPMEYRPTELAREIGCHRSTIYESYVPNGCPHRRDKNGHLWIVGTDFAAWARATIQKRQIELAPGEAFCMRCKRPVAMRGPLREVEADGKRELPDRELEIDFSGNLILVYDVTDGLRDLLDEVELDMAPLAKLY